MQAVFVAVLDMNVRIFSVLAIECKCAQTRPWFILTCERVWGNEVRTHVYSNGKLLSTGKKSPQRRIEPTTLHQAGQRAQDTTNELFRPGWLPDLA